MLEIEADGYANRESTTKQRDTNTICRRKLQSAFQEARTEGSVNNGKSDLLQDIKYLTNERQNTQVNGDRELLRKKRGKSHACVS